MRVATGEEAEEMTAQLISLNEGAQIVMLRRELREWRRRNDLAYQEEWDWRARAIIAHEIRRIRIALRELTGSPA